MAVWITGEVSQECKVATIKVLHKKKYRAECGHCRNLSLVAHAGRVLLKIVANQFGDIARKLGFFPRNSAAFGLGARQPI